MDVSHIDKVKGMLYGACIGDALGAPHERDKNPYTGIMHTKHCSFKKYKIGQVTDDSEMMMALLTSLQNNNGLYCLEDVISSYKNWYQSKPIDIGNNTRWLLQFNHERIIKEMELGNETQSNGCLMRAAPLALCLQEDAIEDCKITNNNDICITSCLVFHAMLRTHLFGSQNIVSSDCEIISQAIADADNARDRNLAKNRGWVIHSLYCALFCDKNFESFEDAMDWTIGRHLDSDTDTNACVVGACMGAKIGFKQMMEERKTRQNYEILATCNAERPREYQPHVVLESFLCWLTQSATTSQK